MRRLRDIIDLYRMALEGKVEDLILEGLLVGTLSSARMPNLVSQLVYPFFHSAIWRCSCPSNDCYPAMAGS